MKKILAVLSVLALMLPISVGAGAASTAFRTVQLENGTLEITQYTGKETKVEVPAEIGGKKVVAINYRAFYGCDSVVTVILPEGIERIRKDAFSLCTNLERIKLPSTLLSIGESAFYCCYNLKRINIPDRVDELGRSAFQACRSLTEVVIPDAVTFLGSDVFRDCSSLERARIGAGVSNRGNPFVNCTKLSEIAVDPGNEAYQLVDGVLFSEDGLILICYPAAKSDPVYEVPEGTGTILGYGFYNNPFLTEVSIPDTVKSLGECTFDGCKALRAISVPPSVKSIPDNFMALCESLESITIPEGITSLGWRSFFGCTSLAEVSLPSTLETIGPSAFLSCGKLTAMTIPANVTEIKVSALPGTFTTVTVSRGSAAEAYCLEHNIPVLYAD